jgi:hypothetical protein
MQRPFLTLVWCFLGGIVCAAAAFLAAKVYIVAHPVQQHRGEDWGAFAGAVLQIGFVLVSPVIGFLLGFNGVLAYCWWRVAD